MRARAGEYSSIEELAADVEFAATGILEELESAKRSEGVNVIAHENDALFAARVKAFRAICKNMFLREEELIRTRSHGNVRTPNEQSTSLSNGPSTTISVDAAQSDSRVALTLLGGKDLSSQKQLFSSLQEPMEASRGNAVFYKPLTEAALPYGIATTRLFPSQAMGLGDDKKRTPTLGEIFAITNPPMPLHLPNPPRNTTTKGSSVGWYQPNLAGGSVRSKHDYLSQKVTTGISLDYRGHLSSPDLTQRPSGRPSSHERAEQPAPVTTDAVEQSTQNIALFCSAYTSFAPSKDDSNSVVSQGLLHKIWWQRSGRQRFDRSLGLDIKTIQAGPEALDSQKGPTNLGDVDMKELEKAINEWDAQDAAIDPQLTQPTSSFEDKDVEEVLQEVSNLLQTLQSFQRNRNMSLGSSSRIASTRDRLVSASPTVPSESELSTYDILQSQLSLMIAMLPPYAVAKLNSDQLEELNISTKIQISAEDYQGSMEEDDAAVRARMSALAGKPPLVRSGAGSLSATNNSSHLTALHGSQYASSSRVTSSNALNYSAASQTPARTTSSSLPRPPATVSGLYGQRPASSTSYRQTGYGTPSYPHQPPRTSPAPYTSSAPSYYQTPSQGYGRGQQQHYAHQAVPQTAPQVGRIGVPSHYQPPTQPAYQQRAQGSHNSLAYNYNAGLAAGRSMSPQKAPGYSPQPSGAQAPRPYGTPTPSLSQRYYSQPLSNGSSSQSHQPPPPPPPTTREQASPAPGHLSSLTAAEQSGLMERQRAQLAQQQGVQQSARTAAQAGAMSASPQPPTNGGSAVAAGH